MNPESYLEDNFPLVFIISASWAYFSFDTTWAIFVREDQMEILYAVLWFKADGYDVQPLAFACV